jgi:hypothetical protein
MSTEPGYLCDAMDAQKRRKLGHNLGKIWPECKTMMQDPTLSRFDGLISNLAKWEDIRYPESIINKGMIGTIGFSKEPVLPKSSQPKYSLALDEIDDLSKVIIEKKMNQKAFVAGLKPDAREFLKRDNKSPIC